MLTIVAPTPPKDYAVHGLHRRLWSGDFSKATTSANETARLIAVWAKQTTAVRREFSDFIKLTTSPTVTRSVRRLLEAGNIEGALQIVDSHVLRFSTVFSKVFQEVGAGESASLATKLGAGASAVSISFDPSFPRAAAMMQKNKLEFVKEFTAAQRNSTRAALVESFKAGDGPIKTARVFRDSIGLTNHQRSAVLNYRKLLETGDAAALTRGIRDRRFDPSVRRAVSTGEPLGAARINRMVEQYRKRYLQFRAETIARTESRRIVSQAQDESLQQAIDQTGMDPANVVRVWRPTLDSRTRDTHFGMAGQERAVGERFVSPSGAQLMFPGDPAAPPAEVINCRCVLEHKIKKPEVTATSSLLAPPLTPAAPVQSARDRAVSMLRWQPPTKSDARWDKLRQGSWSNQGTANVGGAHSKEFWSDPNGDRWMFKPVGRNDPVIALSEEAAYKVNRLLDWQAIEVRTITLDGRFGSIQRWVDDLANEADLTRRPPAALNAKEVAQVQREHALDWMMSNHDAHPAQWLRGKDGHLWGIDKAQAYKHLGNDRLDIDYHPNAVFGERPPYYNQFWKAARDGEIKVNLTHTWKAIAKLQKIPDKKLATILRPYAEARFPRSIADQDDFIQKALARKHSLLSDFEDFTERLGLRAAERVTQPLSGTMDNLADVARDVKKAGWQGKTFTLDKGMIEDQQALVYQVQTKSGPVTVVRAKVRQEFSNDVESVLQRVIPDAGPRQAVVSADEFFDTVLNGVKAVNANVGKTVGQLGSTSHGWLETALTDSFRSRLLVLRLSSDPAQVAMARHYLKWLDQIEDAIEGDEPFTKIKGMFKQFVPPKVTSPKPVKPAKGPFKATRGEGHLPKTENVDYEVREISKRGSKIQDLTKLDFGSGNTGTYVSWNDANLFAQRGYVEIRVPGAPTVTTIETAMDNLKKLGVNVTRPNRADRELLYLQKQSELAKITDTEAYKDLISGITSSKAGTATQVRLHREFWNKRLGVADVTKLEGYSPDGTYQASGRTGAAGQVGHREQLRFDISDRQIEDQFKSYGYHHHVAGGNLPNTIDRILDNNGALMSTIEKERIGVVARGQSPDPDKRTGGANYIFTRVKSTEHMGWGFHFKVKLARRMDAIMYSDDHYGRTDQDSFIRQHRKELKDIPSLSQFGGNETIFKHGITLLDNLERVIVNSRGERGDVLAVFKKHNISTLPDGRSIEDVVVVK